MHQYTIGNIICMIIRNLEVIDLYRAFEDFMLNLLDNDIFSIDKHQNIASTKMNRFRPTLDGRIERMRRCCNDFFAVDKHVNKLVCLVDVGFYNLFQRYISGFFVPCPNNISLVDGLNRRHPCRC